MAQVEVSQLVVEVAFNPDAQVAVSQLVVEVAYSTPKSRIQVSWAELQVPESVGLVVGLNEITLAGTAPNISLALGGTSVTLNEITLAGSAPNITIAPGGISTLMNELTLAGSASALTVTVGGISVPLNELTLVGSAPNLAIVPGAVTVPLTEATLAGSAPNLTLVAVVSVPLNEVTLASSVPNLIVTAVVSVVMNELTLVGSAPTITIPIPSAIVSLNEITLASSAVVLQVIEPQILTPDADVAIGSWTDELGGTTSIFTSIDEPANAISDADFIQSEQLPITSAYEAGLSNVDDPQTSTSHYVSYRYAKDVASASLLDLTVRLKQGVTTIATWSHTNIGTSYITATQELTPSQADAITDYDDLRLEFEADTQ